MKKGKVYIAKEKLQIGTLPQALTVTLTNFLCHENIIIDLLGTPRAEMAQKLHMIAAKLLPPLY